MDSRRAAVSPAIRLGVGVLLGVLVGVVVGWSSVLAALLAGWATVAAVFVVSTWVACAPMTPDDTALHATSEEPTRFASHALVITAALVTLVGVVTVLVDSSIGTLLPTVAIMASVIASWAAIHTVFALRYARMYLTDHAGGIDFHQAEGPRYTDFAYVAVTVGMSFAISDTDLSSSAMRRTALVHALLSYLFGTVIIALLVNLVASI
ncbi:DUF1345 domain-containing protein [Cellulomonas sp. URHD0024]|uniref:DUF1345 domain-containing protein n=1 Tax=Cellulomonas sp. URHD0024 TaxID=1302620 RepID=UPI0003FA3417|nr:DUF1345 domain-containing protein [Cellulomonas sp. URHD0024]